MKWVRIFGLTLMALLMVAFASADPSGPTTATLGASSRFGTAGGANVSAQAGNVTQINFAGNAITQTWQGYFGNVTGTIKLGNSANNTLYDWSLASPSGEIYATRNAATPAWTNVVCATPAQITTEDTAIGTSSSDADRVNNTFLNTTNFNTFYVGAVVINQSSQDCFATYLYNSTGAQSSVFPEVLLHDGGSSFIYTALLEKNVVGFDGNTYDFQMIVGEDGHLGNTATTPYYFYLELH